jgi:hypothetical protein
VSGEMYGDDYSFGDLVDKDTDYNEKTVIEPDDDFSYQEISESKIAGTLQGLLNDTIVSYLKIRSKSKRGNLQKIDAGTFKELWI